MIAFECGPPFQWSPGRFRSTLGGKRYRRYWWLWFAVTIYDGDMKDYGDALRSGGVEWYASETKARQAGA